MIRSVNDFYNSIAGEYNGHMTDSDKKAREFVHELFADRVSNGNVMDFGGGTGLDIPWLSKKYKKVLFVEPAAGMRSVARENNPSTEQVHFIESNTDFTLWNKNELPFPEKVNGIMANFGVLNCIESVDALFEKFSLVASSNCHVIATIIDPNFGGMRKNYSILSAIRLTLASKLRIYNKHDEKFHPTYIHSMRSIKAASRNYFDLQSVIPLKNSTFSVLIFKNR